MGGEGAGDEPVGDRGAFVRAFDFASIEGQPVFADVMEEFARRSLSVRRHPSSLPVDDVDGPGTTGS